jgi:SAM-dependent methyltransferase
MSSVSLYDSQFFDSVRRSSSPSADVTVPLVMTVLKPRSVVDVGCGEGAWLHVFLREGVQRVLGIDGEYVDRDRLLIPSECFLARDLSQPFALKERFDMAVSLEVGEHLPEVSARSFVSSLASCAPVVLFAAAIPGQRGTCHINEQWPQYWAALFSNHGFDCFDVFRKRIWNDERIQWWYRQNMLVYALRGTSEWSSLCGIAQPSLPASLVHPALWDTTQKVLAHAQALAHDPGLKLSVVHIFRALRRRLSL